MPEASRGFLAPYKVLDLTDERGLLAGKMLSDLGADVVHVEPPAGSTARARGPWRPTEQGPVSLYWDAYTAGQRGVTCDMTSASGRNLVLGLVRCADFVLVSARPGLLEAHGLGYETMRKVNPAIVHVQITPFGESGPKAGYEDTDLIIWAAGGPLYPHRDGTMPPVRVSVPQASLNAGGDAAVGALLAHFARLRSGEGQHVEISAQVSVAHATVAKTLAAAVGDENGGAWRQAPSEMLGGKKPPVRVDQSGSGSSTGRSKWRVADGFVEMHLAMGPPGGRTNNLWSWLKEYGADGELPELDWRAVPRLIETGELTLEDLEPYRDRVGAFLATRSKQAIADAAIERSFLAAPVSSVADLAASPQYRFHDFWSVVGRGTTQEVTLPGDYARTSEVAFSRRHRAAPLIGEHTDEVSAEWLGSCPDEAASTQMGPKKEALSRAELPLSGTKVLDLCWAVAGPTNGRVLADFGATVIRVESSTRLDLARLIEPFIGGIADPELNPTYGNYNAGKLGVTLNLSTPSGRQVLQDLVRWADVVTEAFTPGVMEGWGLGYEQLRQLNERIILLSTSLMGGTGPLARTAGYGNVGSALSGFQYLVGWPDRAPFGPYGPYTDAIAPRFSLTLLLAALDHRRRTGRGGHIDLSQAESALHFLAPELAAFFATGEIAERAGNWDAEMAPHGVYPCRPGADTESCWIAIAVRDDPAWARLVALMGGPPQLLAERFATATGRRAGREYLDGQLAGWTQDRTALELEELLQEHGVAAYVALSSRDAQHDTQLAASGYFVELDHPRAERTVVEGPSYRLSETPAAISAAAPTLGQHNSFVLEQILGYDDAKIEKLRSTGALT